MTAALFYIDIGAEFKYNPAGFSEYVTELETNLDASALASIDVYDPVGQILSKSLLKLPGQSSIKFAKVDLFNIPSKLIARLYNTDGVWWADNFVLLDGVLNIDFISTGNDSGGGGIPKSFSGQLTLDGAPVSRSVYAIGLGDSGVVPKLLASSDSDAAGNYTLEWNDYTGQILITASDNYGDVFVAEALLSVGARVHPATPNGYVYEVSNAGTMGTTEPTWPAIEGESITSGQVQLIAKPFYRPKSAGPFLIA